MFCNNKQLHTVIKKIFNLFVVYEITNFHDIESYPTLSNALLAVVKLTKNTNVDKYKHSGYEIGFDGREFYSHPCGGTEINEIIFGADMSYSNHIDNKVRENTF